MGKAADLAFGLKPGMGMIYGWIGIICYGLQIYLDFWAYSDMAIGLGRIFGFRFLENFNHPYLSESISEFWRRWHISFQPGFAIMCIFLWEEVGAVWQKTAGIF